MEQHIRFCRARDGVQIAYATHGRGPLLVRPGTWLSHLEYDWESPVWRHWLEELGRSNTVLRYDERGCGLSQRSVEDLSLDAWVGDLEAVVEAAGSERFDLFGISQGAAIAVEYAARHTEKVRKMVLYGGYARGRMRRGAAEREEAELLVSLVKVGWGSSAKPEFRRAFAQTLLPDATPEELEPIVELQRRSSSTDTAARIRQARGEADVSASAQKVTAETLVLHARDDVMVPFEEGRYLASLIPGARFVALEGRNHIMRADDDGWPVLVAKMNAFLDRPASIPPVVLTAREKDVVRLVAAGLDNEAIAKELVLSVRTVERHLSNVYLKLDLSGRSARAAVAARFAELA